MKLYQVQVIGPNPGRYRGLIGAGEGEAIEKAQLRHKAAGFSLEGNKFIPNSGLTVIGPVVESDAHTTHQVALTDSELAEIEGALLDRVAYLKSRIDVAKHRPSPALPMYQVQLKAAKSALDAVVSA
jgi:hypothetical protein